MSPSGRRQKDDSVRIGQTGSCHSLVESLIICSSGGANETWWSGREVRDSPYPSLLTSRLITTATHSTLFNSLPIKTQENRQSHLEKWSLRGFSLHVFHILFQFKHMRKRLCLLLQSRMLL